MRGLRGLGIQGLANPVFSAGCPGGALSLADVVLSVNPIIYWPMNELAGAAIINYGTLGVAANGLYSNVTLGSTAAPGGGLAPLFNGATSFANIYSAALRAAFDGQSGSIVIWYKSADWTIDSGFLVYLAIDGSNDFGIRHTVTDGEIRTVYLAGGVTDYIDIATGSPVGWTMLTVTWDKPNDQLKAYQNGAQSGLTQTTLGVWAGILHSNYCILGAQSTVPSVPVSGYLSNVVISTDVLTLAQISSFYTAGIANLP